MIPTGWAGLPSQSGIYSLLLRDGLAIAEEQIEMGLVRGSSVTHTNSPLIEENICLKE